jgi:hypothetical protein
MLQWLYTYVSSVCSKCFIRFRRIVQVSYLDVAKLDQDFVYIYASVLGVFIRMLQVFYLDVCNGYTRVFMFFSSALQVFQMYVANVLVVSDVCCKYFIWMLQSRSGVTHVAMRVRSGGGASGPQARFGGAGDVRTARAGACWLEGGRGVQVRGRKRSAARASRHGCPSGCSDASTTIFGMA